MSSLLDSLALLGNQRQAAESRGRDLSVTAGAGSGKTLTLVARYLSLLDEGGSPRSLVAVTFTEKAAREMRNRIRAEINRWRTGQCRPDQRERWAEIEADIDAARIGTIHSLCAALLRAHPAEAGVDPRFDVLDEGLAATLKAQAVEDALAWAAGQPELAPLLFAFETKDLPGLLEQLLNARLDAAAAIEAVESGGDSLPALSKAIEDFVQHGAVQTAVNELQHLQASGRLEADAGDRLASQVEMLLAEWARLEAALSGGRGVEAAQTLFAARRVHLKGGAGRKGAARAAITELRKLYDEKVDGWLGGSRSSDGPPDPGLEAKAAQLLPRLSRLFDRALAAYGRARDLRQALDFDDLEAGAVQLLRRAEIRRRWQAQISELLVDEFQDTNARQREIVEALAGLNEGLSGRLFVVGDAKQSIYRFRGAEVSVFQSLDRDIRMRGGLPLELNLTFRAHNGLVRLLNDILGRAMSATPPAVPFSPLTAHRREPRPGIAPPFVEFLYGLGESAKDARRSAAGLLAQRLAEMRAAGECQWQDVALLFRASTGFGEYEDALDAARIPFVTIAGRGFYDRPEVRDLLNILRALTDPWDDAALAGLLRSPAFGLSDAGLYRLRWPPGHETPATFLEALHGSLAALEEADRQAAERARDFLGRLTPAVDRLGVVALLKRVLDETLYPAVLASAPPGERLQRNAEKLLADAQASRLVRTTEFLEYVDNLRAVGAREGEAPAEAGGAVRLMTVHKAKGLQFPLVVIADASRLKRGGQGGCVLLSPDWGIALNPSRWEAAPLSFRLAKAWEAALEDAELDRLLYVAATRAQEKLIVCGHQTRKRTDVWLRRMAEAAGLDLEALAAQPDYRQEVVLPAIGQVVAGLASQADSGPPPEPAGQTRRPAESEAAALYQPLAAPPQADFGAEPAEAAAAPAFRPAADQQRAPQGAAVGRLVHQALRRWCFPGDPGLDSLLRAHALHMGLVAADDLQRHIEATRRLLKRLRADARWAELNGAERRHEVPYARSVGGRPHTGYIDLLWRAPGGPWRIVDFKTDEVRGEAELRRLIDGGYAWQMRRYRQAVWDLLGAAPEAEICFLDCGGGVRWVQVE